MTYLHSEDAAHCPCCGSPVKESRIIVSLDTNTICIGGRQGYAKLRPQEAEVAFALARAFPRSIHRDAIIQAVWGVSECDIPEKSLEVLMSTLRKKVRPLGINIKNYWRQYRIIDSFDHGGRA